MTQSLAQRRDHATAVRRTKANPLSRVGRRAAEIAFGLPAGKTDYALTRDLATPMSDGVVLLGDLYRPRGASARPVVLIRTPYGRATLASRLLVIPLARRGFQVFIQSTRGTFGCGGHFRPFANEHQDGLETLDWVRTQPWCDGRVATTGGSYFGHTQWSVAPYADPPLEAASLHVTAAHITGAFYENGAPQQLSALSWSDSLARQELRAPMPLLGAIGQRRRVLRALRTRPLRDADIVATGKRAPFWRDFTEHAEAGDIYWDVANHHGVDLGKMPPVNMVTGWWDLFLPQQLHDYTRLREMGVEARLTVGPWLHGALPEFREMVRSDLAWLEYHLHDGPEPTGSPVKIWLQNADRWIGMDTWPPDSASTHRYLTESELAPTPPTAASSSSRFIFDPSDPTPVAGGPLLSPPGQQVDNRPAEARGDTVTFTGPPEHTDLDIVGVTKSQIYVRPELDYLDVFVRLCDVDAAGASRNIVDGIRRLDLRGEAPIGADGVRSVEVDLFPTAYRVKAGHRLRVMLAGGAYPRFTPNPGTGAPLTQDGAQRISPVEILHDAQHPSRLTIPVLPSTR